MPIKFNNSLDEPATEKQMEFLTALLGEYRNALAKREPTEKGTAFLNAVVLPDRPLTKWEASKCIDLFKSPNLVLGHLSAENKRRKAGEKTNDTHLGAAFRSVFPEAYKIIYP